MSTYSQVEYLSSHEGYSCGYCKASNTNYSHGMWAHVLSVDDYQNLIDRGWRRSGMYCYKPTMSQTCCPQYTIRCEATSLKLSKSQKKILKKMTKFLKSGMKDNKKEEPAGDNEYLGEAGGENISEAALLERVADKFKVNEMKGISIDESVTKEKFICADPTEAAVPKTSSSTEECHGKGSPSSSSESKTEISRLKTPRPGDGRDPSKPQCKKARILRLEKKQKKQHNEGSVEICKNKNLPKEKSLEDFINDSREGNTVNTLELKFVRSDLQNREFAETFEESHALYVKYQMTIHKDPPSKCTKKGYIRFLISSPLQIRLLPANSDAETLKASWRLFVKYQMTIHKETEYECSYRTFRDFLVSTPLQPYEDEHGPPSGYGSFHQQYWLNGKLIAVGVIDILPKCVSSVYFFYDPDYSFLSLGTYGSLRELELVRSYAENCPNLIYYYMGFYIHSCPKMKYKARLSPSYLLCPEVYSWHNVEECFPKLDISKYSRLNDDKNATCEDSKVSLSKVLVLWNRVAMTYRVYKCKTMIEDEPEVNEYAELVGRHLSQTMLLYRH